MSDLLVDRRAGSGAYAQTLETLGPSDLSVSLATLPAGDVSFLGHGPSGARDQRIGIEIKRLPELLSSLSNGRLVSVQLPAMLQAFDQAYLLVTGAWRAGKGGELEQPARGTWVAAGFGSRRWTYTTFVRALTSIQAQAGVAWLRAPSKTEAAHLILGLYDWWQTPWRAHGTCKVFYAPPPPRALLTRPSLLRTLAAQIPEVGWEFSSVCEETFASAAEMMTAPAVVWAGLRPEGLTRAGNLRPRIGMTRALRIVAALQGR